MLFLFQQFPGNPGARLLSFLLSHGVARGLAALQELLPLLSQNFSLSLREAITHQVPAAVAQVSMAAAIRRQQCEGKVRNFF